MGIYGIERAVYFGNKKKLCLARLYRSPWPESVDEPDEPDDTRLGMLLVALDTLLERA